MNQSIELKRITANFVSRLPIWPPSLILGLLLTQALNPLIEDGSLLPIADKHISILVEDMGLHFSFTLEGGRFVPISQATDPDLTIRSSLSDFYLLATRQEDPDTLFFNRRLIIEGDTELGLIAKNAMDSLELPKPVLTLSKVLNKINSFKKTS
jgi:predicted lipid carrier protein YhbT